MKTTVLKSKMIYTVPCKDDAIVALIRHVKLALMDEDIQPGDEITMDIRVKIEEAKPCVDKQRKLFEIQS